MSWRTQSDNLACGNTRTKKKQRRNLPWTTFLWITDHVKAHCGFKIANIRAWKWYTTATPPNKQVYFCRASANALHVFEISVTERIRRSWFIQLFVLQQTSRRPGGLVLTGYLSELGTDCTAGSKFNSVISCLCHNQKNQLFFLLKLQALHTTHAQNFIHTRTDTDTFV